MLKTCKQTNILLSVFLAAALVLGAYLISARTDSLKNSSISPLPGGSSSPLPSGDAIAEQPEIKNPTARKTLKNSYHIYQTFNNCGPASLSMALSYFGINKSQQELGQELRPYQNKKGDNDDKSVTLKELERKAQELNFAAFHRPNGSMELIKLFIANDIPVIARTLLATNSDIGHYRVIKGFDETTKELIQDDSLQGKNLKFSYQQFNEIWRAFNYEYLIIVPKEKESAAISILGENGDSKESWRLAAQNAQAALTANPQDAYAGLNLSVALYNIGEYEKSTEAFEKIERNLPFRALWYQTEPIEAYFEQGKYEKVFEMTDKILNSGNRAFSELYIIRGEMRERQGNPAMAEEEFKKAVFYNESSELARQKLEKYAL